LNLLYHPRSDKEIICTKTSLHTNPECYAFTGLQQWVDKYESHMESFFSEHFFGDSHWDRNIHAHGQHAGNIISRGWHLGRRVFHLRRNHLNGRFALKDQESYRKAMLEISVMSVQK